VIDVPTRRVGVDADLSRGDTVSPRRIRWQALSTM
jgi:hypothetical protein